MKIIVTGGAGFIGSWTVEKLLRQGHKVMVVDDLSHGKAAQVPSAAVFHQEDICSPQLGSIFTPGIDAVIHLAAQVSAEESWRNPLQTMRTNLLGTLNVLEQCRRHRIPRIIYAGSAAEIGNPVSLPVSETHPCNPLSPYGISKLQAQPYLTLYSRHYGIKQTTLRFANVFGPRQDTSAEGGVVGIFISSLLAGKVLLIQGTGKQTRDFIYVEDVADALLAALEQGEGIYHVGSGKETSIHNLFMLIQEKTGLNFTPSYGPAREGDISRSVFDTCKIQRDLGWHPCVSLEKGIEKTIEHFRNNLL